MKTDGYYTRQTAPRGSALYYSLLSLTADKRQAIILIHAFYHAIERAIIYCQEPAVTQTKLQWWSEQIPQAYSLQANHPIMQALQPFIVQFHLSQRHFSHIIQAAQVYLQSPLLADNHALHTHLSLLAGSREQLTAEILNEDVAPPIANDLGVGLALIEYWQHLRPLAQLRYVLMPQKAMHQHHLSSEKIALMTATDHCLQALLEQQAQWVRDRLLALPPLPKMMQARLHVVLAQLQKLQSQRWQRLDGSSDLTPLKKLWLSLRS